MSDNVGIYGQSIDRGGEAYKNLSTTESTDYDKKVQSFINDSRWKNGIWWGDSQGRKISDSWSGSGCFAYIADFVKNVYGKNGDPRSGNTFTNANEIRNGDVIYTGSHWFVILYRNENKLTTAEGNCDHAVRISDTAYTVGSFGFSIGYHYQ